VSPRPATNSNLADKGHATAMITILGGPKGLPDSTKIAIREAFSAASIPLLTVSLGPHEQMASACISHLKLMEDSGLLKAAITDLSRLGHAKYNQMVKILESSFSARAAGLISRLFTRSKLSSLAVKKKICKKKPKLMKFVPLLQQSS